MEALGGFPGLHSARLAATQVQRTAALLERLASTPRPWPARFRCAIALALPSGAVHTFAGEARGEIIPDWRGAAGFGYDPVFLVEGTGLTFGEMDPVHKHRLSHRGRAARALLESGLLAGLS